MWQSQQKQTQFFRHLFKYLSANVRSGVVISGEHRGADTFKQGKYLLLCYVRPWLGGSNFEELVKIIQMRRRRRSYPKQEYEQREISKMQMNTENFWNNDQGLACD